MIKKITAILLLICICSSLFALDMKNAQPYSKDEFPKWALNLRRGEIIFLGSLPLTYPVTSLALNALNKDNPPGFWKTMAVACTISAVITIADYVIGIVRSK